MLRYWYYLIPPAYLAVILWLQPADRMVMPSAEYPAPGYPLTGWATRLITDDGDTIAYGIRGENAARGRKAGLVGWGQFGATTGWRYPTNRPEEFVEKLAPFEPVPADRESYEALFEQPGEFRERYFLEYPPLVVWLFRLELLGAAGANADVHPAMLDEHQFYVGIHTPTTDGERALLARFRHVARFHAVLMTLVQLGLMLLVDRLLVLPGFLYFTPCRFDILPAALVLASVAAADRRRVAFAGLLLGLAVAFKMYPLVLAPILLRFTARSWKDAAVWCVCAAVPVLASYGVMCLTDGVTGATVPLRFQLARDHEPQWCFYGKFLPPELAFQTQPWGALRSAFPLLTAIGWSLFRPPDVASVLRRCLLALLAFLTVSVFYSPQWWQWLAVLLVPLAGRSRWLLALTVALDLWTYLHFPILY
ncbi:MAG: hypothetical protein MUF18_16785, partial [Fimbriiglobus sp.]|nr:hypothetical protein [Fimbriiglobus sp.]